MDRVRQRATEWLELADNWDDGDGFILAGSVGAHINSYTGPRGWNASAGHEPPPIQPLLTQLFSMIRVHRRTNNKYLNQARAASR